jgi:HlyD family secretion protein
MALFWDGLHPMHLPFGHLTFCVRLTSVHLTPMRLPFFRQIKRPWPWIIGLSIVGLLAAGAIAFFIARRGPQYDIEALTVPVASDKLTVRITASGTVEPLRTVNLSPNTSGTLESLLVEQGDRVTQGQLIGRMDSDQLDTQLAQNEASVAEAQAQLNNELNGASDTDVRQAEASLSAVRAQLTEARARQTLTENNLDRNQQLFEQGAIARGDLDQSINDNRSAVAAVNQVLAQIDEAEQRLIDQQNGSDEDAIAEAQARLDRAISQRAATEVQLAETEIRAPFDGIVTQRFAEVGAFVTPTATASEVTSATSTAIVAIASGLEVIAEVPEADIGRIKVGQSAEVQADAFPNEVFKGTVRLISPEAIEQQNVTVFQVRVRLLTGEDQLRSNMNTTVSFIGDQLADALVVPTVSIITQNGESGVLVPGEDGRAQFEPVVLGSQVGESIQILDGVEEGDRVFIDLPPGQSLENLTFGRQGQAEGE